MPRNSTFRASNGIVTWNNTLRNLRRPRLLILLRPLCFPELFSTSSNPAYFWICFGDSKRLISPTSAINPAIVIIPTPFMASNFSTFGTCFNTSSSTSFTCASCDSHSLYSSSSMFNSLRAPNPPSNPILLWAASTRICALFKLAPLPRILFSCQIFFTPSAPSFLISLGNGATSKTLRPQAASNFV